MGGVLQLRVPSIKLGHDDVILVPREANTEAARAVLARPDQHTESMVRAACICLRDGGDWMDQKRARHLLKVLDREARLKAVDDAWWLSQRRRLLLIGLFVAVLVIGIVVFDHAWGQHLAAGVAR